MKFFRVLLTLNANSPPSNELAPPMSIVIFDWTKLVAIPVPTLPPLIQSRQDRRKAVTTSH